MLLAVENIKRGTIFETHCIHVQQRQQLLHIVASPLNNLLNIVGCLCAHSACVCGNCSGRAIHNDVDVQNGESSSRETVLATFRRDSQFLPVSRWHLWCDTIVVYGSNLMSMNVLTGTLFRK